MARKIAVEIVGDASSLEREYRRAAAGTDKFNKQVTGTGKSAGGVFSGIGKAAAGAAGLIGIGGFGEAVRASFDEMQNSQRVAAQTNAVLKSTGDVSNVSAKQVDELGLSLMKKSGTDDEVIKSGENMLLTFTNIRNEVGRGNDIFDQATNTMLDMSTALGEDSTKAAMQLGKALNDPIKGVTALRRVGVQFTDDQKKQIKALVDSGHTMQAQKLILHELNREFGGSAEAAGRTLPGRLNILKETLKNLGGQIASQLAPTITKLITQFTNWISKSQNQKLITNTLKGAVEALKTGITFLKGAFELLSRIMGGNANAIKALIGLYVGWKIANLIGNVAKLATTFGLLTTAEGEAAVGAEGLSIALGPAVLVAGALAAGAALGTLLMQIKWVRDAAAAATDAIAGLFGYKNPMDQYKGSVMPSQSQVGTVRKLTGEGWTPAQIHARFPSWNIHDIQVEAGNTTGAVTRGGYAYHIENLHVHANNPRDLAEQLARQSRQRPHVR